MKNSGFFRLLPPALALLTLVAGCGGAGNASGRAGTVAAPEMTLNYIDGREVALSSLKGHVVLLNFWATWCPPCWVELPHFQELHRAYKDDGLAVVGVSMDAGGPDYVRRFVSAFGLTYPIALEPASEMEHIWSKVEAIPTIDAIGREPSFADGSVLLLPTTFIIDRSGMIYEKHVGSRTREQLEPKLRMLMGKEDRVASR